MLLSELVGNEKEDIAVVVEELEVISQFRQRLTAKARALLAEFRHHDFWHAIELPVIDELCVECSQVSGDISIHCVSPLRCTYFAFPSTVYMVYFPASRNIHALPRAKSGLLE